MNINQARSLLRSVMKITKKKCGACGGKREFSIVKEKSNGWERSYVKVHCRCGSMDFKDFDR